MKTSPFRSDGEERQYLQLIHVNYMYEYTCTLHFASSEHISEQHAQLLYGLHRMTRVNNSALSLFDVSRINVKHCTLACSHAKIHRRTLDQVDTRSQSRRMAHCSALHSVCSDGARANAEVPGALPRRAHQVPYCKPVQSPPYNAKWGNRQVPVPVWHSCRRAFSIGADSREIRRGVRVGLYCTVQYTVEVEDR